MLALLALAFLGHPASYDRYKLFELALCADVVVFGEVDELRKATFEFAVGRVIAGEAVPPRLQVCRFENWTCASRWTSYRRGQHVLLFLKRQGANFCTIIGGGGEGEMPVVDSGVVMRGYRIRGYEHGPHRVDDAQVEGAFVSIEEIASAVRGFREAMEWRPGDREQVSRVEPRGTMGDAWALARESRTALELFEEALSSPAWRGPVDYEGYPIPIESPRMLSANEHGLTGPARMEPGRKPNSFNLESWSGFGRSVAFLGDVDGDGVGDLAVGAPTDDLHGHSHGALWILFLDAQGGVRFRTEISERTGGLPAEMNEFAGLGTALAPLGDLDGDGVPDLAIGAPGWDDNGNRSGAGGTWILFLARNGTASRATELGGSLAQSKIGVDRDHGLGASLANIGDLDGDGVPELTIGQHPAFDSDSKNGREILILSLDRAGGIRWVRRIHARLDDFVSGYSWFGDALAGIGDLDGNGVPDLAVADTYDFDGGEVRGAVWILFLASDGSIMGRRKISDWMGGFDAVLRDWEKLGDTLAGPGDIDGDGIVDLLVGSTSGIWTLLLDEDGSVKEYRLMRKLTRDLDDDIAFTSSVACSVLPRASEPSPVFVGGVIGDRGDRDAVIWLLSLEQDGTLRPW